MCGFDSSVHTVGCSYALFREDDRWIARYPESSLILELLRDARVWKDDLRSLLRVDELNWETTCPNYTIIQIVPFMPDAP